MDVYGWVALGIIVKRRILARWKLDCFRRPSAFSQARNLGSMDLAARLDEGPAYQTANTAHMGNIGSGIEGQWQDMTGRQPLHCLTKGGAGVLLWISSPLCLWRERLFISRLAQHLIKGGNCKLGSFH